MSVLVSNVCPVSTDIAGPSDGPLIVLLHAASYTRKMWLPQIERLQDTFRVMALDFPGHGARAGMRFTFRQAVEDVVAALDREERDRALLVGVSLGGCVAMDMAARHPDRVSGLVLSGCTFDPRGLLCRLVLTGESLVFPRGAALFTRSLARYLEERFPGPVAQEMLEAGTYWDAAADAVRAMRGVDFRAKLAAYDGPALILNGQHDWVHRTAERSFAHVAHNAAVQIIPDAGHIASLDAPDSFTDAVREFAVRAEETQELPRIEILG